MRISSTPSPSLQLSPEEAMEYYETQPVDVAIIGSGPAGFSAAINARVRGRSAVILSGAYQDSYLYKASVIDNMPGMPGKSGAELLDLYHEHANQLGAVSIRGQALVIMPYDFGSSKTGAKPGFQIAYGNHVLQAKSVILSTGIAAAKMYPGEEELLGRGVSYCATCDGMLYRGRRVAVIAKSKDALEEAVHLHKIGCAVILLANPSDLKRWEQTIPENVFERVLHAASYTIEGDTFVTGLTADQETIPVSGVFILRSSIAMQSLLSGLAIENNFIVTDKAQITNVPGVFAAGDCTGKPFQIAKALGEGLVAALSADTYLSFLDATDRNVGKDRSS